MKIRITETDQFIIDHALDNMRTFSEYVGGKLLQARKPCATKNANTIGLMLSCRV